MTDYSISSELHVFRGLEASGTGYIMGHEFVGEVVEVGDEVETIKKGDKVVPAFTTSWYVPSTIYIYILDNLRPGTVLTKRNSGECFYCKRRTSSRCEKCLLFGSEKLDGGQAEYVS